MLDLRLLFVVVHDFLLVISVYCVWVLFVIDCFADVGYVALFSVACLTGDFLFVYYRMPTWLQCCLLVFVFGLLFCFDLGGYVVCEYSWFVFGFRCWFVYFVWGCACL